MRAALLRVTLLVALTLGIGSGLLQIWTDLRQEKDAVESAAEEFLTSVAPSAASAAYNYYDQAAEQVVTGLFTQRAIIGVKIVNEGETMIARERRPEPTLPSVGFVGHEDIIVLEQPLHAPVENGTGEVIGSIAVTVDRAMVAPAFAKRLFLYFVSASVKNFVLGVVLSALVYGALARHIVVLADRTGRWSPGDGPLRLPKPPRLLAGTEIEILGERMGQLTKTAAGRIQEAEDSQLATAEINSELSERSQSLAQAVEARTVELQRANDQLKELVEKDGLTGLYNRATFDRLALEVLSNAKARTDHVAILLIDVDHFKAFNDYYGHQRGDDCLKQVARLLSECADRNGFMVARYGGEEFVALIDGGTVESAERCAAAVHAALAAAQIEHQRSSVSDRLTVSIGAASSRPGDLHPEADLSGLIAAADEALYEAKRSGRDGTQFSTAELRERISDQRLAAREMRDAIEQRAFEPFFQPQFDTHTGRLVGVEALARWRRNDGTVVAPFTFLQTASANGVLPQIDSLILDGVADFLKEAKAAGVAIHRVSLNMPQDNLREPEYIAKLTRFARSETARISLELLETATFDAPDDMVKHQLQVLRDAGCQIEVDDFGTGHTSMVSLMSLKPSRLKIARELVSPLLSDSTYEALVHTIVQIGKALGIEVLAEGVENSAISRRLTDLGCVLQQGFFLGRPLPTGEFLARFASTQPRSASGAGAASFTRTAIA